MASADRKVRIFVSSTFRDMHAERDHLVTVVFPELRERLETLGLELYDVDLRWGVPETGVDGEKANSWEYCKKWIDRVEPFFICMLGQRYGHTPGAEDIKDDEDRIAFEGMSITEMEIRHGVLTGRHSKQSSFYFRDAVVPEDTSPDIYNTFVDSAEQERLKKLKAEIREFTTKSLRPARDYACRWTGNGFADLDDFGNLVLEDIWSGVLRDARYVKQEVWRQVLGHSPDDDPLYTDHTNPIPPEISRRIATLAKPEPANPLEAEAEQMSMFAEARLNWFQGREKELKELADFVDDRSPDASRLCVITAPPGQGKSALMAKFASQLNNESVLLITHFVGATERSADVRSLLERLVNELDRKGVPHPEEKPLTDLENLRKRLAERLEKYDDERRVVILIDAVNQLTSGHDLTWLPMRLGSGVRIILSSIVETEMDANTPQARILKAIEMRRPTPLLVKLSGLNEEDVREIIRTYLDERCKELDKEQIAAIAHLKQARTPLYLLVMLREICTLGGDDMHNKVREIISNLESTCPDTVALFTRVLDGLERAYGKEPVSAWCGYLALGRVGMAGAELRDLLLRTQGEEAARQALRIERGIRAYLQKRSGQWDFYHNELRTAVWRKYGLDENAPRMHRDMADYFRGQADPSNDEKWKSSVARPFLELPWHFHKAGRDDDLRELLFDFKWIQAKLDVTDVHAVESDYDIISGDRAHNLLRDALRLSAHVLAADKTQLSCQLTGRLLGFSDEPMQQFVADVRKFTSGPWLRPLHATLTTPGGQLLRTLVGHTGWVNHVALTTDGRAVSASNDNTLRVWNLESGRCLRELNGHTDSIYHVALTADGRAVSVSLDHTLRVWDIETGTCLRVIEMNAFFHIALTDDGRAISSSNGHRLRVWNLETGECLLVLDGHTSFVRHIALTDDGRAISASSDHTLRVWNLETGKCLWVLKGHTDTVNHVAITTDGRAVSASNDSTLRVWNFESGRCLCELNGHTRSINHVALTNDGHAVSASNDNTLRVWDIETGACLRVFRGHTFWINYVVITNCHAVSSSWDNTLRVWDIKSENLQWSCERHTERVNYIALTDDGRAISASYDNALRVWNLDTGKSRELVGHTDYVEHVALTNDGRVVSASGDQTLRVWNIDSGECLQVLEGHTDPVMHVVLTADGRAVSAPLGYKLGVWNIDSGECLRALSGHTEEIRHVALTDDGRAVSASDDHTLRVWDIETGECLRVLNHTKAVYHVALTSDGRVVSVSMWGTRLCVWDIETGECLHDLEEGGVQHIALTNDGRAVTASNDHTLRVWDIDSGECLHELHGHTAPVDYVALTDDGRAISASRDLTLLVWDIESGECMARFEAEDACTYCSVASDNRTIVAGDASGAVHFLRMEGIP